jgi:hypothetical protein
MMEEAERHRSAVAFKRMGRYQLEAAIQSITVFAMLSQGNLHLCSANPAADRVVVRRCMPP